MVSEKKKVLVFPAGTEIAFEIVNALKFSKYVELYGGTSVDDHSEFVYKKLIKGFPFIGEPDFLNYLNNIIDEYKIDCLYPAHDSASVFFSENANKIHSQVIVTEAQTVRICRSKRETYTFFMNEEFVPVIYNNIEEVIDYPVFVKPVIGQGSVGAEKVNSRIELENALLKNDSLIISEYLPGDEYTVDCFTDINGNLLVVKLRDRQRMRAGISVRSKECEADEIIYNIANTINKKLIFKGAWFFQVKKNLAGTYKLMEISPRIPGTMGLSRNLGINFPMLTLYTFWGYEVQIIDNGYNIMLDRAFCSAYKIDFDYDDVYVDYDDTIVINGAPNPDIMRFLYQIKNSGKCIHLLTKHLGDIVEDLRKVGICDRLFDEIIVISKGDEKSDYINSERAIFIDDSFAERKKVQIQKKIPVFDVDMVESLLDYRY